MPNEQMGFTNQIWHTCRCHWKNECKKNLLKNSHYLWSYDDF